MKTCSSNESRSGSEKSECVTTNQSSEQNQDSPVFDKRTHWSHLLYRLEFKSICFNLVLWEWNARSALGWKLFFCLLQALQGIPKWQRLLPGCRLNLRFPNSLNLPLMVQSCCLQVECAEDLKAWEQYLGGFPEGGRGCACARVSRGVLTGHRPWSGARRSNSRASGLVGGIFLDYTECGSWGEILGHLWISLLIPYTCSSTSSLTVSTGGFCIVFCNM